MDMLWRQGAAERWSIQP